MRISDWSSDVCSSDLGSSVPRRNSQPGLSFAAIRSSGPSLTIRRLAWRALGQGSGWSRYSRSSDASGSRSSRSEEHTSELQSLMRISYAVFCLKKKKLYIKLYMNDTKQVAQRTNISTI